MKLTDILRDSNYKLTQFSVDKILRLENSIFLEKDKKNWKLLT